MIKAGVLGATGRMGRSLVQLILERPNDYSLAGAYSRSVTMTGEVPLTQDFESVFTQADLIFDYTSPSALEAHIYAGRKFKKPMIIGTTGLTNLHRQLLIEGGQHIPLIYAENSSLSVALMNTFVAEFAKRLGVSYDVEISECHHRHKLDAPSGTSLGLGRSVARGRGVDFDKVAIFQRDGVRPEGGIGFSVQRGGEIAGEHTVSFISDHDMVSIQHRAFDRLIFSEGALKAGQWLIQQPPGLYHMRDVLGLGSY